ncbi:MAG TPA: thioredoxin family protein [Casimicrobiaceae bacterium]|nr:thioredoxin family protein [Casimicrobiaceae bacterium]
MIATAADRRQIAARWTDEKIAVVSLCAAWCDTCTEFRSALERIASARPEALFVWLDIEDDADICGEIDVENFPTIAIYRGASLLHYGVSLPQEGAVARLVDELAARAEPVSDAPEAVLALPRALR